MKILHDQIGAFSAATQQAFSERISQYIREHFSHRIGPLPQPELIAWIRSVLAVCNRFGLDSEPLAAQTILLYMAVGCESSERPWVEAILDDRDLSAADRLRCVIHTARTRISAVDEVIIYDDLTEVDDG